MAKSYENQASDIETDPTPWTSDRNTDSILILEKTLEQGGQEWVENLNIIEQHLLDIVEAIGQRQPLLKSNFVLRRLPLYCTPFTNRNEYAVVLKEIDFTLQPPRRYSTTDRSNGGNFGQIEVFQPKGNKAQPPHRTTHHPSKMKPSEIYKDILNENKALLSHEIFKKFASAFIRAANPDLLEEESFSDSSDTARSSSPPYCPTEKIQLIGPHLLHDLKTNPEVNNIFTLCPTAKSNAEVRKYGRSKTARCRISVNYIKSLLTISLEETEVIVRPCLFLDKVYNRANSVILDRIPLFHPNLVTICDGLSKGSLLFPTSFETLWTLQFWPCESHLICIYHPSSLPARLFKIFSAFCLNPLHFWEMLNNCFLIGSADDSLDSLSDHARQNLTPDFLFTAFLFQMEKYSSIQDWAPRTFYKRLIHLVTSTVDSYDKGFRSHYFIKTNILRGFWKCPIGGTLDREQSSVFKELDDIEEYPEDGCMTDFAEQSRDYLDQDEDEDYGLHFDALETTEDSDTFSNFTPMSLTSESVYKSVNPFQTEETPETVQQGTDEKYAKKSKSLSKMFGSNLLRRITSLGRSESDVQEHRDSRNERAKSMADITLDFAESVTQNRREETLNQHRQASGLKNSKNAETSFTVSSKGSSRGRSYSVPSPVFIKQHANNVEKNDESTHQAESIYSNILQILQDPPPSDHFSDSRVLADLQRAKRILEAQDELVSQWQEIMDEVPLPKVPCPHTFSSRQIQFIAAVIKKVCLCTSSAPKISPTNENEPKSLPAWEISGDLLRTVLHQMRSEPALDETFKEHGRRAYKPVKRLSLKSFQLRGDDDDDEDADKSSPFKKLSFKRSHADTCKGHMELNVGDDVDMLGESEFAMEEPEIAATNRLLQWLWQLKTSNVGRLSFKAKKYLELLCRNSYYNAHFMEQFSEERILQAMAVRSAVAVTKIMQDENFPAYVPLLAAAKKGWMWAEMVLSLSSWNNEKGFPIQANLPDDDEVSEGEILRDLGVTESVIEKNLKSQAKGNEPDIDAVTLAFHSELATPLGWNDFEDPRRPGPFTVPILIFSSMRYFKNWEAVPGNIIQVMVRLQRFNNLQHVGAVLFHPHRKTALNEIRKLNKSLSFRTFQFDNNVMSKTFKRLASLRSTRLQLKIFPSNRTGTISSSYSTCQELGCTLDRKEETKIMFFKGSEFQCTRL